MVLWFCYHSIAHIWIIKLHAWYHIHLFHTFQNKPYTLNVVFLSTNRTIMTISQTAELIMSSYKQGLIAYRYSNKMYTQLPAFHFIYFFFYNNMWLWLLTEWVYLYISGYWLWGKYTIASMHCKCIEGYVWVYKPHWYARMIIYINHNNV